jgi:hypothetical protein
MALQSHSHNNTDVSSERSNSTPETNTNTNAQLMTDNVISQKLSFLSPALSLGGCDADAPLVARSSPSATPTAVLTPSQESQDSAQLEVTMISASTHERQDTFEINEQTLAIALASLCQQLYQILDKQLKVSRPNSQTETPTITENELNNLMVSADRIRNSLAVPEQSLYTELDRLMALVQAIYLSQGASLQDSPPSYNDLRNSSSSHSDLSTINSELDAVMAIIERVAQSAPKMFDQTFSMTQRHHMNLSAAAISGLITSLMDGRLEFQQQRAQIDPKNKFAALSTLIDQIMVNARRSFVNQRYEMTQGQERQMEVAKLAGLGKSFSYLI